MGVAFCALFLAKREFCKTKFQSKQKNIQIVDLNLTICIFTIFL